MTDEPAPVGEVRLDLNTLPELNEEAIRRGFAAVAPGTLAAYPEPDAASLRAALGARFGLPPEGILVGHGSDELIDLVLRTLVPPGGTVAIVDPSFGMYRHYAALQNARVVALPLGARYPVEALLAADADLTILASPNNPTGSLLARSELEALLAGARGAVLLDEAYAEFAGQQYLPLVGPDRPRLVVTRTFSKAWGLPGIRVGYAAAPPGLASRLALALPPFSVSAFGLAVAHAALEEPSFLDRAVAGAVGERELLYGGLRALGWPVEPSAANFLLVGPLAHAGPLDAALAARGLRVRALDGPDGLAYRRITVGLRRHTRALLDAFSEVAP